MKMRSIPWITATGLQHRFFTDWITNGRLQMTDIWKALLRHLTDLHFLIDDGTKLLPTDEVLHTAGQ